ncbi:PP2C family protein-serine/threonine phosphatase [Thermodesulfobacteriota bacterium]
MDVCYKTDTGLKRSINEDSYLVVDSSNSELDIKSYGMMFAIADGMSGHAGGLKASRMACEGLEDYYKGTLDVFNATDFVNSKLIHLEKTILNTHKKIEKFTEENNEYEHMGTTLSVLVLLNDKAFIAHVGDSRIYRLQDSCLMQLSEDHTMAQLSVEMGYIKSEDVSSSPQRHVLMQSVGESIDQVQTGILELDKKDIFLLCSDGLYNMVSNDEIRDILHDNIDKNTVCDKLVRAALDNGGKDNVTVIVIKV